MCLSLLFFFIYQYYFNDISDDNVAFKKMFIYRGFIVRETCCYMGYLNMYAQSYIICWKKIRAIYIKL